MNRGEFIRRARRYARRNGLDFDYDPAGGKGSHGALTLGDRRTIVPYGEIRRGTLSAMLRQLGIDPQEF